MKKDHFLPIGLFLWCIGVSAQTSTSLSDQLIGGSNTSGITPSVSEPENFSYGNSSTSLRGAGMGFTENKGQVVDIAGKICPDILFKGDGGGLEVYLRKTGISYVQSDIGDVIHKVNEEVEELIKMGTIAEANEEQKKEELLQGKNIKVHRIDMDFVNCNPNVSTICHEEIAGHNNYYYSHCPNGVLEVKQYNKVTCKNIYNNIDIAYYGDKHNGIKYDFIVHPYADPSQIKLGWKWAEEIAIINGRLRIRTSVNEFYESIPKVYQIVNGEIVDVNAEYKLTLSPPSTVLRTGSGRAGEGIVTFELGTWNPELPLVIDPWVTYYGGPGSDFGANVTTDTFGNVYLTGETTSTSGIAAGGVQNIHGGGTSQGDAFVVKFDSQGNRLWATYYGGAAADWANDVAADASGNVYMAGSTLSTAGISSGGFQNVGGGISNSDAFLVKFNSVGVRLWATYYGGSGNEEGRAVVADVSGNVYLAGYTSSSSGISSGGFQNGYGGGTDAFLVKFDGAGARLWATYYGGAGADIGGGVTIDTFGNVYMAGRTASTSGIAAGGFQNVFGGVSDAFLAKFNGAGLRLWATYYGGTGYESGDRQGGGYIATDTFGNVYLAGQAESAGLASGGFQNTHSASIYDVFLVKFSGAGGAASRLWATYYGAGPSGSGNEVAGIVTDGNNNVYLYMEEEDAYTPKLAADACAYQPVYGGGVEDQMIIKFSPTGQKLCATYMGGTGEEDFDKDYGHVGGIAIYGNSLYITGFTDGGYPVTAGAFQTILGGIKDAFVAQLCTNICEAKVLGLNFSANATSICTNTPVTFTPTINNTCDTTGYRFQWIFTGGNPASSTSRNPTVTYPAVGNYKVQLTLTTACKKDSVIKSPYIIVNPCTCPLSAQVTTTNNVACYGGNNGSATVNGLGGSPNYTYSWSNGHTGASITGLNAGVYIVTISDVAGCSYLAQATITQPPATVANVSTTNISCTTNGGASVTITGGVAPYTYSWSNGATTQTVTGLASGSHTIVITNGIGCPTALTFNIATTSPVSATFTYSSACIGSLVNFTNTGTPPGTGVTHNWVISPITPANVSGTTTDFSYTFLSARTYSVEHTVTSAGCTNKVINNITIINCTGTVVTATGSSVCPGSCATVTSSGSGGSSPYTYSWSNGATTQNISPCPAATTTYTVTIRDTGGSTSTSTAVVTINPAVTVTATATNITCNGSANGSVSAAVVGGSPAFSYNWSTGLSGSGSQVSGLSAGTYTVTLTDSKGCTAISTATIVSPPTLSGLFNKGTASCAGCGCKEWLMVNASGGTSPYSFTWPDGYINRYKNKLCPGSYIVNVRDKNGCSINVSLTVP